MQPEFRCNKVVTLEVTYLGTQLEFWYFVLLGFYSLALNLSILSHLSDSQRLNVSCILVLILSIMSHLSDSRRLKVCCPLAVTLEVTNLGTQLEFWNFCTLEVYSLALIQYHESPE